MDASRIRLMPVVLCALIAACSDDSKPNPNLASKRSVTPAKTQSHDAAAPEDAGRSDAGFEPVIVGQTDPLPSSRFAFKTGYYGEEKIWLIDDHDVVRQVPTGDISPLWQSTCGGSGDYSAPGYTDGYFEGAGRFGPLLFDPSGKYLLVSEIRECRRVLGQPSRLLAYELSTGITRVLLETWKNIEMNSSGAGLAVYVARAAERPASDPSPDVPLPDLFVFADGALERVPVPNVRGPQTRLQIEKLGDRVLLLANDVVPLERVDGKWRRSTLFAGLQGVRIDWVGTAASGDRVCGLADLIDGSGNRLETQLWTIDDAGQWRAANVPPDTASAPCVFSPDETRVTFGETDLVFDSAITAPIDPPSSASAYLSWPIGDELYGNSRGADDSVVRLDWSTLATTVVPELATLHDAMCMSGQFTVVVPPPDTRDLTLIRVVCPCTDCEVSNTLTWLRSSGALDTIGTPFQHYDVVWPADSGAIMLLRDSGLASEDPSWFLSIDANAQVHMEGPLDGPTGPMHGAVAPPVKSGGLQ